MKNRKKTVTRKALDEFTVNELLYSIREDEERGAWPWPTTVLSMPTVGKVEMTVRNITSDKPSVVFLAIKPNGECYGHQTLRDAFRFLGIKDPNLFE